MLSCNLPCVLRQDSRWLPCHLCPHTPYMASNANREVTAVTIALDQAFLLYRYDPGAVRDP